MAEAPEKGRTPPRPAADREKEPRRRDAGASPGAPGEELDPREEEGWTQPESSAQKGANPDEG